MPIRDTDVLLKYSNSSASAGNTDAGSVATSLGGFISTTEVPDGDITNVLPDLTGPENAALNTDYACLFVHNNHATLTYKNARVWISADVAGGAVPAIAADPTMLSDVDAATDQAVTIANKNTVPAGVGPFTEPLTAAEAIPLGDIGPGMCAAFWVRRIATNSGTMGGDGMTLRVDGDSEADSV